MKEKELQVIRETELDCRKILIDAESKSINIIHKAKKDAGELYNSLLKEANEEGQVVLDDMERQIEETKRLLTKELEKEVEIIRKDSDKRIIEASGKIFERMWMSGNR